MKLLFDFFPIVLFFIAFKVYDIYVATLVAMIASVGQVIFHKFKYNRFENMHLISMGLILVLGSATLFLHNPWFIKIKPTCIYWLFGLVFFCSSFIGKKNVTQRLMETNLALPDFVWKRLNLAWVVYFLLIGIANLYVAFNFNTDIWVNFKLFGTVGITLLFITIQSLYLSKYLGDKVNQKHLMQNNINMHKPPKE